MQHKRDFWAYGKFLVAIVGLDCGGGGFFFPSVMQEAPLLHFQARAQIKQLFKLKICLLNSNSKPAYRALKPKKKLKY